MKMLTMETKSHTNGVANSLPVNTGGGSQNPQDPASHSMQSQGRKPGQSQILLANQSQVRQQLFSQNIQCCVGDSGIQASVALSSALPSGASLTQFSMPNAVSQGSNMQSGMSQNFSGNLVGEGGVASNMFANSTRQMQGRKLPQQTASQQQQSLSSQQFLYQQQHLLKQKQQQQQLQGNIPSIMQSHMQQQPQLQQQNPIQSTHLQSTLQTHMKMSFGLQPCQSTLQRTWPFAMQSSSGLQQKRQPAFAQSTPNVQQHPQSVIRQPQQQSQQSMHQQAPVLHQQQHPVLPSQQQINAPNLQQNQLIGKQNDVLNMQQRGLVNQQTNVTNMQQYLLGNNIPYQQQLGQQSNMSGLQKQQQQPMHTMHQQGGKAQQQQNAQVSPNMLQFQGKHAQSQPAQQLMSQHPSQTTQMHKQLGLQQQPKSLQSYMQQRIQTSGGSMLNHQSLLDHKQVFHSQTPPPEASSTSIDALMTGNATATGTAIDMQEEVYQTIKSMREKYLPDLSDMRWKISQICQQYDSLPQPPKSEGIELLKNFKIVVDRMMGFLNLPKSNVIPSMKDKLDSYEKQILDILTLHPPRKPGPPQQQIQPTGGHPLSIQQQQEQQQQHQLPSSTSIDAVITGNATATGSLVDVQEEVYQTLSCEKHTLLGRIQLRDMHRKISQICQQYDSLPQPPKCEEIELLKNFKIVVEKMMGFFLALMILVEKTTLHCFHRASIDAAITGNAVDVQEDVYQTIKFMREKYLPDLNKMHQKISLICEQYDSLPQPPKSEQIERLKMFKNLLDQMMGFLNLRKSSVMPSFKDKLVSYEKHIIDILNSNRPRELDD